METRPFEAGAIVSIINEAEEKLNDENDRPKIKDKKEKKFRGSVDHFYHITSLTLSVITTTATFYFPPLALAAAIALGIISGVHYIDKKNGYKISHWLSDKLDKIKDCFQTNNTENNDTLKINHHSTNKIIHSLEEAKKIETQMSDRSSAHTQTVIETRVETDNKTSQIVVSIATQHAAMFSQASQTSRICLVDADTEINQAARCQ